MYPLTVFLAHISFEPIFDPHLRPGGFLGILWLTETFADLILGKKEQKKQQPEFRRSHISSSSTSQLHYLQNINKSISFDYCDNLTLTAAERLRALRRRRSPLQQRRSSGEVFWFSDEVRDEVEERGQINFVY